MPVICLRREGSGASGGPRPRALRCAVACLAVILAGVGIFAAGPADAARHPVRAARHAPAAAGPAPVGAYFLLDAETGRVISEVNADAVTYPASLAKMMTLYLTFRALNDGALKLDQRLPISEYAAGRPPTKLGLRAGDTVTVRNLILGIVTRSANDAAAVLAEGLAGSEPAFCRRMNQEARLLGMTRTHYENASGLPEPGVNLTTARDVAQLALALYHDFPREFHYFSTREFDFRGRTIRGHDHLLSSYPGVDGIKTGYIRASGFNLATSAVRNGHRLIGVVLGGRTASSRDRQMEAMLDGGFADLGVAPVLMADRQAPRPRAIVAAAARPAPPPPKPSPIANAAARFAANLSPVSRAEAAPLQRRAADTRRARDARRWSIQLGAFHAEAAARKVALEAARQRLAKGKPMLILRPGKEGKDGLYRARLIDFTAKEASAACTGLRHLRIACSVVPPPVQKFASR
ncbi:MAG TPA: D-alanyl-D-alanine carboxypeptidase [Stellaceae bacterium]|nr:D-alanyl-D-alanine carboxypeptidase [Stellaceae bacterium]